MPKSGLQRALDAMRSAIPMVQKLLPLIDGNFATAVSALMAPQHHQAQPPVQVDLEPVERGLAEVRNSNRELRTQVQEQGTTLKRVEDQLDRVREATDRNTLEQQELVEDLRAVGNRISTFAIIGVVLLLVSLALNGYLIFQLQHILR
jgi:septal ring factor EnvC (AmiA/AmiB activator)